MSTKRFIITTTIKIIAFAIISTIAMTLLQSPVISNNIALGQMGNSDAAFMLMETYNKVRPFVEVIYSCITVLFIGTTAYDIYKFIKTKIKEKNENETH